MTTQDVALPTDYETGLEDFDPTEAGLPRIHINHGEGTFVDKQTNEEFPIMYGVFLGLIKQRVFWPREVEDDMKPYCKSNDAEWGFPNMTGPRGSLFPWSESGMNPATQPKDEHGRVQIKCETCPFAEWTNKDGKQVPPRCSERYTMPVHFNTTGPEGPHTHAGIISFQRSSLTPLKRFIGAFSRSKEPLFSALFSMKLDLNKRGNVTYSVPKVARLGRTLDADWQDYATEYRSVRDMLRRPPRPTEGDSVLPAATNNNWNPAAGSAAAAAGVVEATVVEDPWAVNQQVTPAAEPTWPAQPAQPLVGAGLVDAASTPVAAPARTATVPVAAAADDDDLPF
jgi:hypothetical protein